MVVPSAARTILILSRFSNSFDMFPVLLKPLSLVSAPHVCQGFFTFCWSTWMIRFSLRGVFSIENISAALAAFKMWYATHFFTVILLYLCGMLLSIFCFLEWLSRLGGYALKLGLTASPPLVIWLLWREKTIMYLLAKVLVSWFGDMGGWVLSQLGCWCWRNSKVLKSLTLQDCLLVCLLGRSPCTGHVSSHCRRFKLNFNGDKRVGIANLLRILWEFSVLCFPTCANSLNWGIASSYKLKVSHPQFQIPSLPPEAPDLVRDAVEDRRSAMRSN